MSVKWIKMAGLILSWQASKIGIHRIILARQQVVEVITFAPLRSILEMFDEKEFERLCDNLTVEERQFKYREIFSQIEATKKRLIRMKSLLNRMKQIEGDIKYHSTELKILRKLKSAANREANIVFTNA